MEKLIVNGHNILFIVAVTFITSFILTFFVKKIAIYINAIDVPNERKVHKKAMPRLGGLAIYCSFLVGYMFFGTLSTQMISVLIGSFIIILTGFIDDVKPIPAYAKLIGQVICAAITVFYGKLFFTNLTFLGLNFVFPSWINMLLSIFFIVSIINAINLIDGLDGLASGNSIIYFLSIAILGYILNLTSGLDVTLALIMFGATLGFFPHNFPTAKIFLGDTGSLFLGYIISVIALLGFKLTTLTSMVIPIIILFVPIIDTLLAIIRRIIKRKAIGVADKKHLHHQLLRMTNSPLKSVLIIFGMNFLFSFISILYVLGDSMFAILIYVFILLIFLFLILKTDIIFDRRKH